MNNQNKGVLASCNPHAVFRFFEDICAIPRGSANEAAIADYIEGFARERGLYCYRDGVHNVFIKCPATEGHESAPAVLLQGHTDMVCEKDDGVAHDFETDGLDLFVEDGWIGARGTTLGGDDGVAVAMMLAILDEPPMPHPAIECLFTVSEETGLVGAWAFDPVAAGMTARTMINLDSESEGVLTAGCAGGMRTDIKVPVDTEPVTGTPVRIALTGFSGGHSGVEIHEGHTNAVKLLGRLLRALWLDYEMSFIAIEGGGKDNAIPRAVTLTLSCTDDAEDFCRAVRTEAEKLRAEPNIIAADRDFSCTVEMLTEDIPMVQMDATSTRWIFNYLTLGRDGVLEMNAHVKGLVAYSRNLGIVETLCDGDGTPTHVRFAFSTRSACENHLDDAEREMQQLAAICSEGMAEVSHHSRYPGWEYAPTSPLRELWTRVSEETCGMTPRVEVIHAGLECGILSSKTDGMDIISVGPDMRDIHTPRERLHIASTERTYAIVRRVIEKMA